MKDEKSLELGNRSQSGAVLVIVLMVLVLLVALVVGLLRRVETDRANAASFRGGTLSEILSEYAINTMKAQIHAATTDDPTLAWASQPGAIRTYSATGPALQKIYKLYSAPVMVGDAVSTLNSDTTALENWVDNRALFTDLNAPVESGGRTNYPILDPTGEGVVKGFEIKKGAPSTTGQTAPMPVWWLYVLQDGTLVAPTAGSQPNTVNVPGATPENPITGRIAFWTDDETCKINVNTASGAPWDFDQTTVTTNWINPLTTRRPGNFWDTPIIGSTQDVNLAISQPWSGEFQRYPGHPATISLSAALPSLNSWQAIERFAPRVADQDSGDFGSRWGSHVEPNTAAGPQNVFKLPDDANRLYSTIDEAFFAASNRAAGLQIPAAEIEQARFFLTANSRAPDVTLFNTPKILNWPITTSKPLTAFDQLIAFCGTVGDNITIGGPGSYYFTRRDPDSPTVDYDIARNQTLLGYLRRMTTRAVPGFGGPSGILGKYGADSEQILTEIFDYIRITNSRQNIGTTGAADPTHMYAPNGTIFPTHGAGDTRGFGRFPTITKAGILFWFDSYVTPESPATSDIRLTARLLLEPFFAAHGHPDTNTAGRYSFMVDGLQNLRWGIDKASALPMFTAGTKNATSWSGGLHSRPHGGRVSITGFRDIKFQTDEPPPVFPPGTSSLYFSGGTITIRVTNSGAPAVVNQAITITLPEANVPFPTSTASSPLGSGDGAASWTAGNNRFQSKDVRKLFRAEDAVRAVGVSHGDFRLVAATPTVLASSFARVNGYDDPARNLVHNFVGEFPYTFRGAQFLARNYYEAGNTTFTTPNPPADSAAANQGSFYWVSGDAVEPTTSAVTGDFDNGYGAAGDGPYIGFADEGNARVYATYDGGGVPYLDGSGALFLPSEGYFSPNRLVPSAAIMGSLPTGVISQTPWQTLLFRPAALTSASHPGLSAPPDYLLLDLFNMPVVEPYAISEPLSTAGRVNMNYQIQPFTWIHRSTALQAALHTEQILAISNNLISNQTRYTAGPAGNSARDSRYLLNLDRTNGTLKGFEDRFATGDLFRSAAEICTIPLVPDEPSASYDSMASWWQSYRVTGDNSKERPYARIYPKLTTKSNIFTVHYRVESLRKRPGGSQALWEEDKDTVVSTLRGSATIERYVDARDPDLPDYAAMTTLPPTGANALPNFYRWRTLGETRFNP